MSEEPYNIVREYHAGNFDSFSARSADEKKELVDYLFTPREKLNTADSEQFPLLYDTNDKGIIAGTHESITDDVIDGLIQRNLHDKVHYLISRRNESTNTQKERESRYLDSIISLERSPNLTDAAKIVLEAHQYFWKEDKEKIKEDDRNGILYFDTKHKKEQYTINKLVTLMRASPDPTTILDEAVKYDESLVRKGLFAHKKNTRKLGQPYTLSQSLAQEYLSDVKDKSVAQEFYMKSMRSIMQSQLALSETDIPVPFMGLPNMLSVAEKLTEICATLKDRDGAGDAFQKKQTYQQMLEERTSTQKARTNEELSAMLGSDITTAGAPQIITQGAIPTPENQALLAQFEAGRTVTPGKHNKNR